MIHGRVKLQAINNRVICVFSRNWSRGLIKLPRTKPKIVWICSAENEYEMQHMKIWWRNAPIHECVINFSRSTIAFNIYEGQTMSAGICLILLAVFWPGQTRSSHAMKQWTRRAAPTVLSCPYIVTWSCSISNQICKYGFVVFCFDVVISAFIMDSWDKFAHTSVYPIKCAHGFVVFCFCFGLYQHLSWIHGMHSLIFFSISNQICTWHCYGCIIFYSRFMWYIYSYSSGLLPWHWGNHMIAPVPVKYPWRVWVKFTSIWPY